MERRLLVVVVPHHRPSKRRMYETPARRHSIF